MGEHKDSNQSDGRKANAAKPLDAARENQGAERYPPARQDDAIVGKGARSFNPQPRQGADDGSAPAGVSGGAFSR